MIRWILRVLRGLLSARPPDPEPADRFYIRTDGAVEPYLEDEHGRPLRAVVPGSREDTFSVLHRTDPASLTQRALYYFVREEYDAVERVLYQLGSHLNKLAESLPQEERT